MATNVTLNGSTYSIPAEGDSSWGTNVSNYLIGIAAGVFQKTGGTFTLTAEADFGATYGLKLPYIKSQGTNPSSAGVIRLANAETISWRNAANNADLSITVNASNVFQFNGAGFLQSGNIVNADINASAAIALSKLAALTVSRLLVSDGSGIVSVSSVTSTEAGYLSGVTSAIQTQLDAKQARSTLTTKGDLYVATASATVARQAVGTDGQVLTADSGQTNGVIWATPSSSPTASYEISNLGLATSVGSSALTIALKQADGSTNPGAGASAVKVGMRSSTLTSGLYNQRSATAATSLVISSGSTLGQTSTKPATIWIYLIDNAGTLELAASGTLYDENQVISTTAEGGAGAADSSTVVYSTTARSNVPFRLIGKLINTQTTAGTWASAGTTLQVGTFGSLVGFVPPSVQTFTSGSGTYYTPAGVKYIKVRMVGGGGQGAGGGTGATSGGAGAASTFGSSLLTANGGAGGVAGAATTSAGGSATVTTSSSVLQLVAITGGAGGNAGFSNSGANYTAGGVGASSPFGGAGVGAIAAAGTAAAANTGSGGGGGGVTNVANLYSGNGGAAGGYLEAILNSPSTSYAYAVGAGGSGAGAAGTSGFAAGAGGSGFIQITEYYQ